MNTPKFSPGETVIITPSSELSASFDIPELTAMRSKCAGVIDRVHSVQRRESDGRFLYMFDSDMDPVTLYKQLHCCIMWDEDELKSTSGS